jgi:hypothetical protein
MIYLSVLQVALVDNRTGITYRELCEVFYLFKSYKCTEPLSVRGRPNLFRSFRSFRSTSRGQAFGYAYHIHSFLSASRPVHWTGDAYIISTRARVEMQAG